MMEAQGNACVDYVLDVAARGRDWVIELPGTELIVFSQVRFTTKSYNTRSMMIVISVSTVLRPACIELSSQVGCYSR